MPINGNNWRLWKKRGACIAHSWIIIRRIKSQADIFVYINRTYVLFHQRVKSTLCRTKLFLPLLSCRWLLVQPPSPAGMNGETTSLRTSCRQKAFWMASPRNLLNTMLSRFLNHRPRLDRWHTRGATRWYWLQCMPSKTIVRLPWNYPAYSSSRDSWSAFIYWRRTASHGLKACSSFPCSRSTRCWLIFSIKSFRTSHFYFFQRLRCCWWRTRRNAAHLITYCLEV